MDTYGPGGIGYVRAQVEMKSEGTPNVQEDSPWEPTHAVETLRHVKDGTRQGPV